MSTNLCFTSLMSLAVIAAVTSQPACDIRAISNECGFATLDKFLIRPTGMTEDQLRSSCRGLRAYGLCQAEGVVNNVNCVPSDFKAAIPAGKAILQAVTAHPMVCDAPELFAKYQAVGPCVQTLSELRYDNPVMLSLSECYDTALVSVSTIREGQTSNSSSILHGICCKANKLTECATAAVAVNGTCSSSAIAVVRDMSTLLRVAIGCPSAGGCA